MQTILNINWHLTFDIKTPICPQGHFVVLSSLLEGRYLLQRSPQYCALYFINFHFPFYPLAEVAVQPFHIICSYPHIPLRGTPSIILTVDTWHIRCVDRSWYLLYRVTSEARAICYRRWHLSYWQGLAVPPWIMQPVWFVDLHDRWWLRAAHACHFSSDITQEWYLYIDMKRNLSGRSWNGSKMEQFIPESKIRL